MANKRKTSIKMFRTAGTNK